MEGLRKSGVSKATRLDLSKVKNLLGREDQSPDSIKTLQDEMDEFQLHGS